MLINGRHRKLFSTIRAMQLPEPSKDALAASVALIHRIRQEIRDNAEWISFARFMELALYADGLGYYAGGSAKLGKDGDFTTAPEITSLFGATLAAFAAELAGDAPIRILEFGAGSGKLARDVLLALDGMGKLVEEYAIVELSAELRQRQRTLLEGVAAVRWLDGPPPRFSGLVIANEVLDAMPVPLVIKKGKSWAERGVGIKEDAFIFVDRVCAPELVAQIPEAEKLPDGYLTEVHPLQAGFMRMLGDMLVAGQGGTAVLIDYGFPAAEYYLSDRQQGTLMCHYRHHSHTDPFFHIGLQDITAHVDFTAAASAALESGLTVMAYLSQAAFLLNAGLPELMQRGDPEDVLTWLPQANAVQKLTSPAEMGELFKVLIVGAGADLPARFARHDRSHRL
jgi:SAM-dependent MidA family methyltransferase